MATLPSMKGKVCIVTGANTGIGKATAAGLARAGATTILACRDQSRGGAALDEIRAQVPGADAHLLLLDLASQARIRDFVGAFEEKFQRLDVLVNNAAVFPTKRAITPDGLEMQFGVNHLGPFLLTNLLLPRLLSSAPSRVVVVSSTVHYGKVLDFDDLQSERKYESMGVYGRSKLANILFVRALAKRLEGKQVTVNALHPGVIATELIRDMMLPIRFLAGLFLKSPEKGASVPLYLATSPEVEGMTGRYYHSNGRERTPSEAALDDAAAERLWSISAQLTGLP
jgi:NAD(P)-dependent dehydrogenase (short-subunit alcohol dehydrogenase family)